MNIAIDSQPDLRTLTSDKALIAGILNQAAYDLRRYRSMNTEAERELYVDAYTWIVAEDCYWPFSFLNVCQSLGLVPDFVRAELLAEASAGFFSYCVRRSGRLARALGASITRAVARNSQSNNFGEDWAAPVFQAQ